MASVSTDAVPGHLVIVVMGVSGSGKTTVAQLLAASLGVEFVEGDDFHSEANVERMRAGIALTDADRRGWLQALAQRLAAARQQGKGLVLSCSALKRSYRDVLRAAVPDLQLVHLSGDFELVESRLAARPSHYMPSSLLRSQFADLQAPEADEGAHVFNIRQSPQQIADDFCNQMARPA